MIRKIGRWIGRKWRGFLRFFGFLFLEDLQSAIESGDDAKMLSYLKQHDKDDVPQEALFWAIHSSNLSAMKILIEAGADVNDPKLVEATFEKQNFRMFQLLVDEGAPWDREKLPSLIRIISDYIAVIKKAANFLGMLQLNLRFSVVIPTKTKEEQWIADLMDARDEATAKKVYEAWEEERFLADLKLKILHGSQNEIEECLKQNPKDNIPQEALFWAIDSNNWTAMKILIQSGVHVNNSQLVEKTFQKLNFRAFQLLIDAGAPWEKSVLPPLMRRIFDYVSTIKSQTSNFNQSGNIHAQNRIQEWVYQMMDARDEETAENLYLAWVKGSDEIAEALLNNQEEDDDLKVEMVGSGYVFNHSQLISSEKKTADSSGTVHSKRKTNRLH